MSDPWCRKVTLGDGRVTLYEGDCLEILPHLERVDAVVTDPPYGVNFSGKVTKHSRAVDGYALGDTCIGPIAIEAALKQATRGVVFPGLRLLFSYPQPREISCVFCPSGAGIGRWGFTVMHPVLFYGMAQKHALQSPAGIQSFDVIRESIAHPCPKPLRWMHWAVTKATRESEAILDPFMGSGTTGVAAVQLGRRFIGIEIEPRYFDISVERIIHALAQPRLFEDEPTPEQEALL